MKIALDAMGGDYAPENIVHGAVLALAELQQISKLYLTGDQARVEAELRKHGCNDGRVEIVHTTQVVTMADSGLDAVRRKKDSSVSRAVDSYTHLRAHDTLKERVCRAPLADTK